MVKVQFLCGLFECPDLAFGSLTYCGTHIEDRVSAAPGSVLSVASVFETRLQHVRPRHVTTLWFMASWGDALEALSDHGASESGGEGAGWWSAALGNLEEGSSSSDPDHPPPLHAWQGALDAVGVEEGDSGAS